jgi:hypothetical protein
LPTTATKQKQHTVKHNHDKTRQEDQGDCHQQQHQQQQLFTPYLRAAYQAA